jgi:hypothetical protein
VVLRFPAPGHATCAGRAEPAGEPTGRHGDRSAVLRIAGLGDNDAMRAVRTDLDVGPAPNLNDQARRRHFGVTEPAARVGSLVA